MRLPLLTLCLGLILCLALTAVGCNTPGKTTRQVYVHGGGRLLDGGWRPINEQFSYGAEFVANNTWWPAGFEVGVSSSNARMDATSATEEVTFNEIYGGMRRIWGPDSFHPYVSLGLSAVNVEGQTGASGTQAPFDEWTPGGYLRIGAALDITPHLVLGIDFKGMRGLGGDVAGRKVGYGQTSLFFGFGF